MSRPHPPLKVGGATVRDQLGGRRTGRGPAMPSVADTDHQSKKQVTEPTA
jgi:hypothetical protein